jgi:hypothetical protein
MCECVRNGYEKAEPYSAHCRDCLIKKASYAKDEFDTYKHKIFEMPELNKKGQKKLSIRLLYCVKSTYPRTFGYSLFSAKEVVMSE